MKNKQIRLFNLLRHMQKNGVHLTKISNMVPWFLKFSLLEPIHLLEWTINRNKIRNLRVDSAPIFILGFYRSGTTFLQRLLVHDNRFGYQRIVDTAYPELMLSMEWLIMPFLNAWKSIFRPDNKFQRIPLQWEQPGEEDLALLSLGWEESLTWGFLFPSAFEEFFNRYALFQGGNLDIEKWKQRYLYWLKKLSAKYESRPLVLKNPPNMARISLLLELFPNAKFIFIYRNPYDVYASNKYLWKITDEDYSFQVVKSERVSEIIIYSYRLLTAKYLETRNLIPTGRLFEMKYEELTADPLTMLEELYSSLNIPGFEMVRPRLIKSLDSLGKYKQTVYSLSDEEKNLIEENWGKLIDQLSIGIS